jgi:guanylate kinase
MTVDLKNIEQFREVLKSYAPSERAIKAIREIPIALFTGVSGAGRNTIINHLVETGRYRFMVSDTTRPPKVRDGQLEQDGVHYHFRSEEDVLQDLRNGEFLEAEVIHNQQVSGISIRELEEGGSSGKILVTDVDVEGPANVLRAKPNARVFFIVPPSYEEWLKRLKARETMSDEELTNRTQTAIRIIKHALQQKNYSFVINVSSLESAHMVDKQMQRDMFDRKHDAEVREIAKKILAQLEEHNS